MSEISFPQDPQTDSPDDPNGDIETSEPTEEWHAPWLLPDVEYTSG